MEGSGTSQEDGGSGTSQEEGMMEGCTNPSFSEATSTEFVTHKPPVSISPSFSIDLDPELAAFRVEPDVLKEILNMPEAELVFPGQTVQCHDQRPKHAPQAMGSSQPPQAQQTSDMGMDRSQVCHTNTQGG